MRKNKDGFIPRFAFVVRAFARPRTAEYSRKRPRTGTRIGFQSILGLGSLLILLASSPAYSRGQAGSGVLDGDRPRLSGPLSLKDAVETALRGNFDVQAARFEADAAHEETRALRAMTRPQISANTYLSSGDMRNILGTPPGSSPVNALTVPTKRFVDQNLTLMVPLYTGGKLGNLVKAASQRESAGRASLGEAEADAALMVREAYYRALLAAEMAKVAEARVNASTALVASTRAQFEAGKGIQASVSRADAELADAGRMLANAQNDRAKMLLDLKRAMGVQLDSDITLSDVLVIAPPPEDLGASLIEAARIRPELLAARARLDSAKAQAGAARGAYKPQLYGAAMGDAFAPGDMGKRVGGTVGLIVSIPLLDSGQRSAEVRQMEAMRRRSEAELKEMELRVATEVRQARLDMETAAANYRAVQTVLQSFEAAYDVVVLRVESQRSILLEQLDALAALTQARANLAEAVFNHSMAVARLQRAIGRP